MIHWENNQVGDLKNKTLEKFMLTVFCGDSLQGHAVLQTQKFLS
jgi:hypothetical protein